jgi:hypothetical protein
MIVARAGNIQGPDGGHAYSGHAAWEDSLRHRHENGLLIAAFLQLQSSVKNVFIRGSVVRYVHLPANAVDTPLLEDATRRGTHAISQKSRERMFADIMDTEASQTASKAKQTAP